MLVLCILSCSFLYTVCSKVSDSHACHAHNILSYAQFAQSFQTLSCLPYAFCFVPACAVCSKFSDSHACSVHSISLSPLQFAQKFQTRSCLPCAFSFVSAYAQFAQRFQTLLWLPCAFCFVSAYASLLTGFWRSFTGLVQLIFSFPSWFHTIWFYCSHTFHNFLSQITLCFSFGSKDMITAFTCLPSYR